MFKGLEEGMKTMTHQIETIKKRQIIKKTECKF